MTPNEEVIRFLFDFLTENGVTCWGEKPDKNDLVGMVREGWGEPFFGSGINPQFYTGLALRGGGKFKVKYIGRLGEVIVTDIRHSRSFGVTNVNVEIAGGTFPICDPDCFEMVLGVVK